jgi:ribosomal protein L37AE/L43A
MDHSDVENLKKMNVCPNCKSTNTRRISRALWMRIFASSVQILCGDCGNRFVKFRESPQGNA